MADRAEIYLIDSYVKEHETIVADVVDDGIILEEVIFYPRGGGQPDDRGVIVVDGNEIEVKGLRKENGKLVLQIDEKLEVGQQVLQKIDWDYRYQLMKHHTSLHVLSAVVWEDFDAKVTGGTIYHDKARLDFDLMEFNSEIADRIVAKTNELISQNHDISIEFVSREEAEKDPNLIRTKVNLLPKFVKEIRLVKIGDVDIQADGGLHVKNTSEIGKISLVKTENKGKGRKRISISVD